MPLKRVWIWRLLVAVVVGLTWTQRVCAQFLPPACQRLSAVAPSLIHLPSPGTWDRATRLLPGLRVALGMTSITDTVASDTAMLGRFWRQDSVAVELGLALLATSDDYSTRREADVASSTYWHLSGRPSTMLSVMFAGGSPSRRDLGLVAIRKLEDSTQQLAVFYFACNAIWDLNVLASDSAYQRLWRINWTTTQYYRDAGTLSQASRLLSGSRRDLVVAAIKNAIPTLQPITVFPYNWPSIDSGVARSGRNQVRSSVADSTTGTNDASVTNMLYDTVSFFTANPYIAVSVEEWQHARAVKVVVQDSVVARAGNGVRNAKALVIARFVRQVLIHDRMLRFVIVGWRAEGAGTTGAEYLYVFPIDELARARGLEKS